jgi:uroporphyrinogen decarboxylase
LWRHWPGDDQDAAALAAAHLKWQRDYDWDFLKVSPASSFAIRDWGTDDRWIGHIEGTRQHTERVIAEPDDWVKLAPLDPGQGSLAVQIEALRLVGEGVGESVPFLATVFSPLSQARNLAGEDRLLVHLRREPEAVLAGLAVIAETTRRYVEAAKATGIAGIYYAVQHTRYTHLTPAEYAQFGRPGDLDVLTAAGDLWLNLMHVHGVSAYLSPLADYPVQLVNWHDREDSPSLREGLDLFGTAVCGGVSRWAAHQESPEVALAEAADAYRQTEGRRWVLGTGCVTMVTTPTRNLRALRAFVETV